MGMEVLFPGGGGSGRGVKVKHSPPTGAEVKIEWSYTSTSPVCLHGLDNESIFFYFYFTYNRDNAHKILQTRCGNSEVCYREVKAYKISTLVKRLRK
jgi:hypothetical protein